MTSNQHQLSIQTSHSKRFRGIHRLFSALVRCMQKMFQKLKFQAIFQYFCESSAQGLTIRIGIFHFSAIFLTLTVVFQILFAPATAM